MAIALYKGRGPRPRRSDRRCGHRERARWHCHQSKPTPMAESYSARGRVYKNQVMGTWQHTSAESYAEGLFMLVVNPLANVMYGYCTGHNESGGMIFETWVLVKKTGLTESQINAQLLWGEKALKGQTIRLTLL